MDGQPPPPPPPHGSNPKTTGGGLPDGHYDIFIIPPHSSGGGFLYLPSLKPQWNSFFLGVAVSVSALIIWKSISPTLQQWFYLATSGMNSGGNPVLLLIIVVGFLGWAYGQQFPSAPAAGTGAGGPHGAAGAGATPGSGGYQRAQSPPNGGFPGAGGPRPNGTPGGGWHGQHQQHGAGPHEGGSSWGGSQPDPHAQAEWERAKEDTRKDEERKKKEEADRQARAKAEKEKWEKMRAREREQREREARERIAKERMQKQKEEKERQDRERQAKEAEARAKIEKEIREKLEAEQRAKAAEEAKKKAEEDKKAAEAAAVKAKADSERAERLKAARERAQRDREARLKAEAEKLTTPPNLKAATARRSTTYGGAGGGERLDPYAGSKSPPAPSVTSTHSSPIKATVSPKKNYEKPSASSYVGTEDEHSFRPYDTPKRPPRPPSHHSSVFSESSYAPSQSTSRTTPPPSQRGPYSTSDPDKIQIKAVFLFNDLFPKPVAQLVAGIGNVTDGLILKITTEGMFIDDDIRNIAQREWDVKAWTLKLIETGERQSKHFLRASVRDADGKKYVFIIPPSESWKVALGIQRLRGGSMVRSMGFNQMPPGDMQKVLNTVPPLP
ncbi:hypothetical protein BDV96DRAFT_600527 [Lophiotrema nucula]|uniref:Uncharacterized protein n=1 Tax=Lophiotrema nucula TaxID=690887 RepID=A0A6A5Z552_9PLEO|nr:hypothetical protein BDV96DRAFT_600527 [Lophiotrema nucula]